jgi:hypothetical protein
MTRFQVVLIFGIIDVELFISVQSGTGNDLTENNEE